MSAEATVKVVVDGERRINVGEIAELTQVPSRYLAKVMQGLARAGLDRSQFHRLAVQLAHEDQGHLALLRAGYERTPRP